MKRILFFILLIACSFVADSQALTKELLIGKWLIVKIGDLETETLGVGTDIWQFTQSEWIVISNNTRFRPESYTVKSGQIILGLSPNTYSVKVIEFTATKLVTDSNGIIQTLQKIPQGQEINHEN